MGGTHLSLIHFYSHNTRTHSYLFSYIWIQFRIGSVFGPACEVGNRNAEKKKKNFKKNKKWIKCHVLLEKIKLLNSLIFFTVPTKTRASLPDSPRSMDPNPKQFFLRSVFSVYAAIHAEKKKLSCLGILMICPAVGWYVLSVPCLAYLGICNYQSTSILLAFLIDPIYTPIKSVDLHSGTGSKPSLCFCLAFLLGTLFDIWI